MSHKCPVLNRYYVAFRWDPFPCFVCLQSAYEKREKHWDRVQIRKSVLKLCCICPGSPGQLGYHVIEKIAIFSSGSLTYLSPLTDSPPPATPTYPFSSLFLPLCVSHSSCTPSLPLPLTHSSAVGLSHPPLPLHAHLYLTASFFSFTLPSPVLMQEKHEDLQCWDYTILHLSN